MKWINVADEMPEIIPINESTGMSNKVLAWLDNEGTFITASVIADFDEHKVKWITGYNGFDVTESVTYWANIKGPYVFIN